MVKNFMFKVGPQFIGAAIIWQLALATHAQACTGGCDEKTGVCFSADSQCGPAVWKWPPCPSLRRMSDAAWLADAPTEMPGRHAAFCMSGHLRPIQPVPSDAPSEQ